MLGSAILHPIRSVRVVWQVHSRLIRLLPNILTQLRMGHALIRIIHMQYYIHNAFKSNENKCSSPRAFRWVMRPVPVYGIHWHFHAEILVRRVTSVGSLFYMDTRNALLPIIWKKRTKWILDRHFFRIVGVSRCLRDRPFNSHRPHPYIFPGFVWLAASSVPTVSGRHHPSWRFSISRTRIRYFQFLFVAWVLKLHTHPWPRLLSIIIITRTILPEPDWSYKTYFVLPTCPGSILRIHWKCVPFPLSKTTSVGYDLECVGFRFSPQSNERIISFVCIRWCFYSCEWTALVLFPSMKLCSKWNSECFQIKCCWA